MNVGIIGCGKIGQKRAESLGDNTLKAVADIHLQSAYDLAMKYEGVKVFSDYKELLKIPEIDIVIVSTVNNMLAPIASDAMRAKKHVLIEKPGAIHHSELDVLILLAEKYNVQVKVGYNLRYHPAINKAIFICREGDIGELMFLTIHYGHGGRLGYNKEWRSNKEISGGGELEDQGVHCIDLAQCILGDLSLISGKIKTYFWDMKVEDNAFLILENEKGNIAQIQVSCTEWRNTFSLEIYGKTGKLKVEGLGGSYGTEKLTLYKMLPEMGIPQITTFEYAQPDNSFEKEFIQFVNFIWFKEEPWSNLKESQKILKIVDEVYECNK